MHGEIDMSTTVGRLDLLVTLGQNRETHKKIFEEALGGYKKEMIRLLCKMLKDVRKGKRVRHMINLPIPQNMTDQYDTVMKMLEMGTQDEVKLSSNDFRCFVEDKWDWKQTFLLSNSRYSNTAQIMSASLEDE
jgi:hypothetical protein